MRDFQKHINRLHLALDIIITVASYLFSYFLLIHIGPKNPNPGTPYLEYWVLGLIAVVYAIIYGIFQMYQPKRVLGRRLEATRVLEANLMGMLVFFLVLYLTKEFNFSRTMIAFFTAFNTCALIIERNIVRLILTNIRRRGGNLKHVLVVGYSRAAESYIDRCLNNPQWGYKIRGILDDEKERGHEYKKIRVIGTMSDLNAILDINRLDEIIITLKLDRYSLLGEIVKACEKSGVHTKFVPDYNNIIPTKPYTEDLLGLPVVHIRHVPLMSMFNRMVKRTEDLFGCILAIILSSPVMAIIAIMVKTSSKGPVIYKQERVGLHNKLFYMYKFRSMAVESSETEKVKWTKKDDPRVTKVGKFIRRTSLDELPQLFNVLLGQMSLVGPRPERPYFVEKFKEEIPRYMVKHQVRPGMTGWAQVNGLRGDTSIKDRIEYDLYYIENWTVGLDIKIMLLTVFKGFINKNAY